MKFEPVSVIIPCLNEEKSIIATLDSLARQSVPLGEIIIIDAGSKDSTINLIDAYKKRSSIRIGLINKLGALPGAGRNEGIARAQYNLVAFIDCGVLPEVNWLENLLNYRQKNNTTFSWGSCIFTGNTFSQKLICAYSNGYMKKIFNVLPGSLFDKSVFDQIGFFNEDLRAAEDSIWRDSFFKVFKERAFSEAVVSYSGYPEDIVSAAKKWFLYSKNMVNAGVGEKQQLAYLLFFLTLLTTLFISIDIFFLQLFIYLVLRGYIDPLRRAGDRSWFFMNFRFALVGPLFSFILDISKFLGFIVGRVSNEK